MLNIHDLERRWIKYKIKSLLPLVLSVLSLVSVIVIALIYLPSSLQEEKEKQKVAVTETTIKTEEVQKNPIQDDSPELSTDLTIEVPQNTQQQPNVNQGSSLVLKPSLRFMDNIEDSLPSYVQDPYQLPKKTTVQENALNYQSEEVVTQQTETIAKEEIEENKLTLTITKQKNDDDLKDVIRRFKKNKNPTLSLFIAKHYYKAGNYQKSYNYALMTNEIDKTIEESWIIFAKSLVKLGQKELAQNTLKSYLKTTKSSAAEVLLRKIESGDFK